MNEFCGGSPFWNITETWTTDDPDFTLCFKLTALVWGPCAFLLLFSPLDIYYMKISKFANIPWSFLNIFKFIIIDLMLIISIIDFVMSIANQNIENVYNANIVAAAVKIITFIYAVILTYFHKKFGIRSSGLLFLFWFLLCICGIPQYRSEIRNASNLSFSGDDFIWTEYQFISYMIYFPLTVFILIASCFADNEPQIRNVPKTEKPSPELRSSFIRNIFFQWFDSTIWKGYRKPLVSDDMFDINVENTSNEIIPRFDKFWWENVEKNRIKKKKKDNLNEKKSMKIDDQNSVSRETNGSVLIPMIKAFGGPFLFAGVIKLITDLLSFASPQLLSLLITFTATNEPIWKGFLYAFSLFALSILTSLLNGQYLYKSYLVGFRIRSALVNAIYRKALKISSNAKKTTTVGEIVNLMAVDAQRFQELMAYLHILWSGLLIIALALYFLWEILGVATLSGLAVMILLIPVNGFIAAKMKTFQVKQMKKKDERVKLMNEILNGMKVLKLYAWEESFEKTVHDVRDIEMKIIKDMAYFNAGTYFLWTMAPFLVSLASFATFVLIDENNVLNANVAFVSISLFNILRMPMALFPLMIALIMQAWVSIVRINKFLNNEELDPENVTYEKNPNALLIENGTFTWGEKPLLHNINLKVPKGDLCAIVGPVGTGKSSIISAMLGEMEKLEGSVNLDGTLAFVSQQAWIQNSTVQDNILFGKPMNREFYNIVLESCALIPDLKMLPGGDLTEIGEKGINLSGGQKQRISMARAVYNNAEIYLLDDPLSAVDSHVGKHIFDKVIGPTGLLAGKTVLLVTHGISYLPKVNNIFVMLNGEITESGHYDKLIEQKGAFSDFILQHLQELDDTEELNEIKEVLGGKPLFERAISLRTSNTEKKVEKEVRVSLKTKKLKSTDDIEKVTVDATKLMHSEDSATGSVGFDVYVRYFKNIGIVFMTITIIASGLNQAASVYSNTWLADWAADTNNVVPHIRNTYLGVYGALGVGQAIALFVSSIVLALGSIYAAKDIHNRLLKHSFRLPMSFFDTTPLGRIINRFSKDIDMIDNILPTSVRTWILMIFSVCGIFVVISISTPIFISVIVPISILYYFIQKIYVATSRQLRRIESVTRSPIYSHFGESITGQSTIRAYNVQDRFIEDSTIKVDFNQKCTYPTIVANRWLSIRLEIVGSFVILFAALFAVLGREALTGAIVGLSVSYSLQITQVLSFLVRMTAEVETNIVAIERVEEYSELETEAPLITKNMDPSWPQSGDVSFNEYKLRYRDGLDLVLKGISFSVKGGEKVGIVGRTGAGKSSLTLALFRIIEAADGKIIIDGENIAEMGLNSLRSRLTIIPQDPVIFSGTLRMNVDPFNQYRDDEIWLALQHAHLKAYVKGLSEGLSHVIAEGGENLSVGQRQLVCLARALLRKTKVLILDEATAAVDLETDDLIQKTIRSQFSDCTILTIAHRLNTIMDSDRIIVLDAGYVAEYDTPKNLLHNKDSIFYGMAKSAGLIN